MNTFPESSIMDAPKQIDVVIKCNGRTYDDDKYFDIDDCYLAEALKKQGFKDVTVGGCGFANINRKHYHPKNNFDCIVIEEAFANNLDIPVTLILQH